MVKIFVFTSVHQWNDGRIFHRQVKTLAEHYQVELHAVADFNKKEIDNITVFGVPRWNSLLSRIRNILLLLVRAVKSDADAFHFHDPELLLIAPLIKIIKRKPIVFDVHEDYPALIKDKKYIPAAFRNIVSVLFEIFERFVIQFVDKIFVTTELIAERYRKHQLSKVGMVPNVPPLSFFPNEPKPINHRLNRAVFLGGLTPVRGIVEIIKAFKIVTAQFPSYSLLLIGQFTNQEFENKINELILNLNLQNNIIHKSNLPYEELHEILSTVKIGYVTYLPLANNISCIPNKIIEYMAAGLAVIASNFENYKMIIEKNNCGRTVDPLDVERIAEESIHIIQNPDQAEIFSTNSRMFFVEKYNWQVEKIKFMRMYYDLVQS